MHTNDDVGKLEKLEYYKSLVTDDEVIGALVRESKAREGELEKSRVRPNINFFQRTVTNLVSTNKRIIKQQELAARERYKYKDCRKKEIYARKKSERIEFVKSSSSNIDGSSYCTSVESSSRTYIESDSSDDVEIISVNFPSSKIRKGPVRKKSHLQLIHEILLDTPKSNTRAKTSRSLERKAKSVSKSSRLSFVDTDSDS